MAEAGVRSGRSGECMRDWIVGYRKAARNAGPGVGEGELQRQEEQAGIGMPEELRDLYREMNGGELLEGVVLFPLRAQAGDDGRFADARSSGAWSFGAKGDSQELIAVPRGALAVEAGGATVPEWVQNVEEAAWLYVARDPQKQQLRVYRTLEQMLATMIPPPQVEEFGDVTYARALTAVRGAIETMREETGDSTVSKVTARPKPSKKPGKSKAKPKPKAKAKASSAKSRKKPAAKSAKKTGKKKPAVRAKRGPAKKAKKAGKRR